MPATARSVDLKLIVAAGTAMLVLAVVTFALFPPDGAPRQTGSTYDAGPDGAKGAFLALRESGWSVERSIEPIAALRTDPRRTTIVLASPSLGPSDQDRAALARFVAAGGNVLAGGTGAAAFLPGLSEQTFGPRAPAARTYVPGFPGPLTRGVTSIRMARRPSSLTVDRTRWLPVLVDGNDPGALTTRPGSGRFIWWGSTDPLSNGGIREPGNLELLLNALGPAGERRVLWDEHYHGYGRTLWSYVAATPIAWGLAQIGLVAVLALFTHGRYLGPVRGRVIIPRTSPLEFVDTMGGLYERSRPAAAAVTSARAHVRRRLAARAGIPVSSTDAALATALGRRFGIDVPAAASALDRSRTIADGSGPVREADALALVATLQRLAQDAHLPASASTVARSHDAHTATEGRRPR